MMELTTTALFLFSTFYGGVPSDVKNSERAALPAASSAVEQVVDQPLTLEEYIREYFKDAPVMAEIAKCESRFRHLGKNGKVLRGELTVEDTGVMQINTYFHEDTAKVLGLDLHTLDGNLAYAKWLYNKEGTMPWFASSKCWQKSDVLARMNSSENSGGLAKATIKATAN